MIALAIKHFPQYTVRDIYEQFNEHTLYTLVIALSKNEYEEKKFTAKCAGLEIEEPKKVKPMKKDDWKLFMQEIKKSEADYKMKSNLRSLPGGARRWKK